MKTGEGGDRKGVETGRWEGLGRDREEGRKETETQRGTEKDRNRRETERDRDRDREKILCNFEVQSNRLSQSFSVPFVCST